MVRTSSVVLPEPGLETRLSAKTPVPANRARLAAAKALFLPRMSLLDLDDAVLAQPGHMHAGRPLAEMQVAPWSCPWSWSWPWS